MSTDIKKFTREEQAQHCDQLVAVLEETSAVNYDHSVFVEAGRRSNECGTIACALGWAAIRGIGGLKLEQKVNPVHPDLMSYVESMWQVTRDSADHVFGDDAWQRIFAAENTSYDDKLAEAHDEGETVDDLDVQQTDRDEAINRLIDQAISLRKPA